MKRVSAAVALLTLLASSSSAAAELPGGPVVASGSFILSDGPDFHRTFAFHVLEHADGTVSGTAQVTLGFPGFGGESLTGSITCFERIGNQAVIGVTYTRSWWATGLTLVFGVQDDPDLATLLYYRPDWTVVNCETYTNEIGPYWGFNDLAGFIAVGGIPVESGTIVLHD